MFDAKTGRPIDLGEVWTGEDSKRLHEAYRAVYGGLDDSRAYRIDQMCEMFTLAREIYAVMLLAEKGKIERTAATGRTGALAEQFHIHLDNLREAYGWCAKDELCRRIDATSKWLIERGWFGLPEPEDKDGAKHYKTAAGMCADAKACMDAYHELARATRLLEANESAANGAKRKERA